jgi:hypothetical protein
MPGEVLTIKEVGALAERGRWFGAPPRVGERHGQI